MAVAGKFAWLDDHSLQVIVFGEIGPKRLEDSRVYLLIDAVCLDNDPGLGYFFTGKFVKRDKSVYIRAFIASVKPGCLWREPAKGVHRSRAPSAQIE